MGLSSEKPFEWLNENSRKFLAAGYLGEGLCAEERIADIAKRAEEILQMPGLCKQILSLHVRRILFVGISCLVKLWKRARFTNQLFWFSY